MPPKLSIESDSSSSGANIKTPPGKFTPKGIFDSTSSDDDSLKNKKPQNPRKSNISFDDSDSDESFKPKNQQPIQRKTTPKQNKPPAFSDSSDESDIKPQSKKSERKTAEFSYTESESSYSDDDDILPASKPKAQQRPPPSSSSSYAEDKSPKLKNYRPSAADILSSDSDESTIQLQPQKSSKQSPKLKKQIISDDSTDESSVKARRRISRNSSSDRDQWSNAVRDIKRDDEAKAQKELERKQKEEKERKDKEDLERKQKEEKERKEREEKERKQKEEKERKEKEEKERKEKERKEKEEKERKAREEKERKEREEKERKEREEKERKEREEKERKQREEIERKQKEEKNKKKKSSSSSESSSESNTEDESHISRKAPNVNDESSGSKLDKPPLKDSSPSSSTFNNNNKFSAASTPVRRSPLRRHHTTLPITIDQELSPARKTRPLPQIQYEDFNPFEMYYSPSKNGSEDESISVAFQSPMKQYRKPSFTVEEQKVPKHDKPRIAPDEDEKDNKDEGVIKIKKDDREPLFKHHDLDWSFDIQIQKQPTVKHAVEELTKQFSIRPLASALSRRQ